MYAMHNKLSVGLTPKFILKDLIKKDKISPTEVSRQKGLLENVWILCELLIIRSYFQMILLTMTK